MQKFTSGENKGEKVRARQKRTRKGVGEGTEKWKLSSGQAEGTVKVSRMRVTELQNHSYWKRHIQDHQVQLNS